MSRLPRIFSVNGSLTSRCSIPDLFAAIWTGGREAVLVSDQLERTTKEALTATLSSINDCPYCGDMMVSLVHAGDRHDDAVQILGETEGNITDPLLRERLLWVRAVATPGAAPPPSTPFNRAQLPEDMQWARANPRIADAVARWAAAVERESEQVIPERTHQLVHDNLKQWHGERMSISRNWVEQEVDGLEGNGRAIGRLALVVAKASYQTDDKLVAEVLKYNPAQQQFLRILARSSFTAARYVASRIARLSGNSGTVLRQVA